jgi:hypothetical protein
MEENPVKEFDGYDIVDESRLTKTTNSSPRYMRFKNRT